MTPEETDELIGHFPKPPGTHPKTITYTTYYSGEDDVRREVQLDRNPKAGDSGAASLTAIEAVARVITAQDGEDLDPVRSASTTVLEQIDEDAPIWEQATIAAP